MDPAAVVKLILGVGITLIVIAIGVRSRPGDTLMLIRRRELGARAMLAMFVLVPAFVLFLTWAVPLARPVRTALLALSVSPMPPIISGKEIKAGGDADYAIGLQVLGTAFSILVVPIMLAIAEPVFGITGSFDPFAMSKLLVVTVALPLAIGMALGRFRPRWLTPIALWAARLGNAALLVGAVAVLFKTWPDMLALIGGGVLWVTAATIGFALLVGHLLGGPDPGNRGALAVACAARHPGVAISLSTAIFPEHAAAIVATVLLFLIANLILTIPYMRWRKQVTGAMP